MTSKSHWRQIFDHNLTSFAIYVEIGARGEAAQSLPPVCVLFDCRRVVRGAQNNHGEAVSVRTKGLGVPLLAQDNIGYNGG